MTSGFVWFDHRSTNLDAAKKFYAEVCAFQISSGPGDMAMVMGKDGPWAGISPVDPAAATVTGWVPYIKVDDVTAATKKAKARGAKILQERTEGPAGFFSLIQDPTGAAVALWQKK